MELALWTLLKVIFKDGTTALYTAKSFKHLVKDKSVTAIHHDATGIILYRRGA